eukprot:9102467-Lingulodinium_polyedra.AAC.1
MSVVPAALPCLAGATMAEVEAQACTWWTHSFSFGQPEFIFDGDLDLPLDSTLVIGEAFFSAPGQVVSDCEPRLLENV